MESHVGARINSPSWIKPSVHPGEGNGNLLQYSCLENPMDRGAWWAVHPLNYRSSAEVVVAVGGLVTKSCLTLASHGL